MGGASCRLHGHGVLAANDQRWHDLPILGTRRTLKVTCGFWLLVAEPCCFSPPILSTAQNIINWSRFSVHLRKRQVPLVASILRNISDAKQLEMHVVQRRYKRAFVWWRPDGLAYEYTLASLGQRVLSLGLGRSGR